MNTINSCFSIKDNCRVFEFNECLNYLITHGKNKYKNFEIERNDLELIFKLLCYAIRDEETCAKYGIDLTKGILLSGPVGCGKTSLMNLLNNFNYPGYKYQVKGTLEISAEFNKDGFNIIYKYGRREKVLCLDDLGIEQNMKYFGNECNTIGEILLHRYDMHINYGIVTHATTNLNSEELEKLYGSRVRSRLRSMFNLISFPATTKDKRK